MISLKIDSEIYKADIPLDRRITFLRGDSGVGKSVLVDMVLASSNPGNRITLFCDKEVIIVQPNSDNYDLYNRKNKLFIMDDLLLSEMESWLNSDVILSLVNNDSYLLIINRVETFDNSYSLEYSMKSVLLMKTNGVHHWCEKAIEGSGEFTNDTASNCDVIVTEDNYGMYGFLKSYVSNKVIISSGGKDNILSVLYNLPRNIKNIFLFADSAVFGQYLSDLIKYSYYRSEVSLSMDSDYECFEYLLLKSNFFNKEFKFDTIECNKHVSWEKYFEKVIAQLSRGSFIEYHHGKKLRSCYLSDCDSAGNCNKFKQSKCKYFVPGEKLEGLLKGTEFEYILEMR